MLEAARFWSKVIIRGVDDCWGWAGAIGRRSDSGYAFAQWNGRSIGAHRVALILSGRTPSNGDVVDHLCSNRACVNPRHLEIVSPRENTLRGYGPTAQNARKESCKRGHALSGPNLITRPGGWRGCRACKSERAKASRRAARAATLTQDHTNAE